MIVEGPGSKHVDTWLIACVFLAQFTFAILTLYLLVRLWPHPTPSMRGADTSASVPIAPATPATTTAAGTSPCGSRQCDPKIEGEEFCRCERIAEREQYRFKEHDRLVRFDPQCLSVFGYIFPLWNEQRLMLLVILSGLLGGFVHALRSLHWYVGNRKLKSSWLPTYAVLPLVGGLMSLMFYLVFRGGLFSPQSSIADTSPFGFAAMSALVGMFSGRAAVKLQKIFDMLMSPPEEGRDAVKNPVPVIVSIASVNDGELRIEGRNFAEGIFARARKDGGEWTRLDTTLDDDTTATAKLPPPLQDANLTVTITNLPPGGGESDPFEYTVV